MRVRSAATTDGLKRPPWWECRRSASSYSLTALAASPILSAMLAADTWSRRDAAERQRRWMEDGWEKEGR